MRKKILSLFAIVLSAALLMTCFPTMAFADDTETTLSMTEGEVKSSFVPAGTKCDSADSSVAWVDSDGNLNALKQGSTTITVPADEGSTEYTVNVSDYSDGSEVVGKLKILARYNDSMQFYDGHVYLLFTSYQDGVEIAVPDLYAGYKISDKYYKDINENISAGSNHTGNDTDKYFTFDKDMKSVTLDRGEIVTIGMYRGFDLSVPEAALGSIKNSSAWKQIKKEGKTKIIENLFKFLDTGKISTDELIAELKNIFSEIGVNYTKALDGVVEGGVCFNRELYNQKLEWDQYENVTYELDITKNQLTMMTMYLRGNLNNFSILKNSCATVALRGWNAAVGTRNGEPTAYNLNAAGEGIFAMIDAPKTVKQNIMAHLPGYYLNNAQGVAEPDAGYQDDTGWVYVSAPEKVSPINFTYADDTIQIDSDRTKMSSIINACKGRHAIVYDKDNQEILADVQTSEDEQGTSINSVQFSINGEEIALDEETSLEKGVWFMVKVEEPAEGEDYYVVNAEGKAFASEYSGGYVSFFTKSVPVIFKVMKSSECAQNILKTSIKNEDKADVVTEVYTKADGEKKVLDKFTELSSGEKVYVKSDFAEDEFDYALSDITINGTSVYKSENYDEAEDAYFFTMPEKYSRLVISYEKAVLTKTGKTMIQISIGDTLNVDDYAALVVGTEQSDKFVWKYMDGNESAFTVNGKDLKAESQGQALFWACCESNANIGVPFIVEAYDTIDDMVKISFDETNVHDFLISAKYGDDDRVIAYTDYLVKKGSVLTVTPTQADAKVVSSLTANGTPVKPNEAITVNSDTELKISFTEAYVDNMPKSIQLDEQGDKYQLNAQVKYSGASALQPVYDQSVRYESSDELVKVDENGLLTVAQAVPKSGKVVYVTAYAGSSNNTIFSKSKVVLGDYQGERIVGRLTVSARPITEGQLVAHGALTFTTYEDTNLGVSYYEYYKPNEKYNTLVEDYTAHPENYTCDPALYSNNELGLENRDSYFDTKHNGANSETEMLSLSAGESLTMSNYGFDASNIDCILKALKGGSIASSQEAQALIYQMERYTRGEEIDGEMAFDSLVATIMRMYMTAQITGKNPADGQSEGGFCLNREIFNQFRRDDSQMPNNYYTVDITADEFALLQSYISNPDNNYYSLFVKNCATGVVDIWNATLADRPELKLTANLTGLANDPQSLYYDIGAMKYKKGLDGKSGTDFYPRTVKYSDEVKAAIAKIKAIGKVEFTDECKARIDDARGAYSLLSSVEKQSIWNYDTLTAAEARYAELKKEYEATELTESTDPSEVTESTDPTEATATTAATEPTQVTDNTTEATQATTTNPTYIYAFAAKSTIYVEASTRVFYSITNGSGKTQFTSSNTKVATVSSTGKVKGKKVGTVTITVKNNGKSATVKIKIVKRTNPMTVKAKAVKVKAKAKKTTFKKSKALTIKKAQGKVTYKKASGSKKITVNKKTGKITVKKGLKKGKTYKLKVKVKAKGNYKYKAKTKTVTVKIKVK